ncbi:MAG: NAD(P)/FAD-dependent oxidoreductase, partial [Gammaproteobacteria bacterium]
MKHTHDMIIIGAGIAGSTMALAASVQGLRVALIDKQTPSIVTPELSLRVSNINYASEQFLNTLGVIFPDDRRGIFNNIKIFQENNSNTLNFSASALHMPYLGSIIENNLLIDLIQTQLRTHHVNCYYGVTGEKFTITETSALVNIPEIGELSAPLMIGAEGAHSLLRQHCGILQDEKPYAQT